LPKFYQGRFTPKNPGKYNGDVKNIIFRSSWEYILLKWLDNEPNVISYSSEETVIPYRSPVDGKMHRYFVDFAVTMKTKEGIKKFLVEVKPHSQTIEPKKPKRLTEGFKKQVYTYLINKAKWDAATAFAKHFNAEFIILTENELIKRNK
jgi:hypothetical protein